MLKQEQLLYEKRELLLVEQAQLQVAHTNSSRVLSEYEKTLMFLQTDQKKYEATQKVLKQIDQVIIKVKEEKRYALERAILLGLNTLMHKKDFIQSVVVRIEEDVMDVDLYDANHTIINKTDLSKGEQQLYATALLKALVDESGIDFPVFIDSPLQKFDKTHSSNVIKQFYPNISDQVVLFPLLEKELTKAEYDLMLPDLNNVFMIYRDEEGSAIKKEAKSKLFTAFNKQNKIDHVLAN